MAEPESHPVEAETPSEAPSDDELAGLDDHARRLIATARRERERANSEAAAFRHELGELRQAFQDLQRKHESEQERRDREAEERGRASAQAEHDQVVAGYELRLLEEALRTRAAPTFNNAEDAVRMIDLDPVAREKDSGRRAKMIDAALARLLEDKPYLARQNHRPLVTQGGRSEQPGRSRERSWLRG